MKSSTHKHSKIFWWKVIIRNSDTSKLVNYISAGSLSYPCPFLFQTHLKSAVQLNDVTTFARLWALKRRRENTPTESDPLISLSAVKQPICLTLELLSLKHHSIITTVVLKTVLNFRHLTSKFLNSLDIVNPDLKHWYWTMLGSSSQ